MMQGLKLLMVLIYILGSLCVTGGLLRLLKVGAPLWVVLAVGFLAWLVLTWVFVKSARRFDD